MAVCLFGDLVFVFKISAATMCVKAGKTEKHIKRAFPSWFSAQLIYTVKELKYHQAFSRWSSTVLWHYSSFYRLHLLRVSQLKPKNYTTCSLFNFRATNSTTNMFFSSELGFKNAVDVGVYNMATSRSQNCGNIKLPFGCSLSSDCSTKTCRINFAGLEFVSQTKINKCASPVTVTVSLQVLH